MKIEHFKDIEALQLAPVCRCAGMREFARKVYLKYRPTVNLELLNRERYQFIKEYVL
jgi:hypothetical protein